MSEKVLQVYDFKVVEGTVMRARICNCLNHHWTMFLRNYELYKKQDSEWTMLAEVLYSQLDMMSLYVALLEEIGVIRLSKSDEFLNLIGEYRKMITSEQITKCVNCEVEEE